MRTTARLLAAVFAGALVLAACGGGDDDASGGDTNEDSANQDDGRNAENGDDDGDAQNDRDDDDREGGLPDPCKLVTAEDAAELFGEGLEARESEDESPVDIGAACIWENVGGDELGNPSHLLQVRVYDGKQFYSEEIFDNDEPLEGIGDQGFVTSGDGLAGVDVQFVDGDTVVTLNYVIINIGVEDDRVEATSKRDEVVELARQAARRM